MVVIDAQLAPGEHLIGAFGMGLVGRASAKPSGRTLWSLPLRLRGTSMLTSVMLTETNRPKMSIPQVGFLLCRSACISEMNYHGHWEHIIMAGTFRGY